MSEAMAVTSTDGLTLEAAVDAPADPRAVCVLCHPHPQMGGTMNAPLLITLSHHLVDAGWAVVRFNYRGIGSSQGESSDGIAEVADAEGAASYARARWPGVPVAICGWSFGGAVAIRVAMKDKHLIACATIAPAVTAKPGITAGAPPPEEVALSCPLVVVCGSNDKQVSPQDCRQWALAAAASFIEVPGANHFFWAKYEQLAGVIEKFLAGALAGSSGKDAN